VSWVKLDDRFHCHRKVRKAGLEAVGLHARALSYTAAEDLQGHVEAGWVEEAAGKRAGKLTAALVDVGLWETNGDGGWIIHDYLAFNPSSEERADKAASAKRAADVRWAKRNA
jgi:hypothetical protein